jgi:outer membrane protein TolC
MRVSVWSVFFLLAWNGRSAPPQTPAAPTGLHLLDAVNSAITRHPALQMQREEVEISNAVQREASSAFDQLVEAGVQRDRVYTPQAAVTGFTLSPSNSAQSGVSYSKLLRNGMSVNGSINLRRQIDAVIQDGLTTSSTNLQVVMPLMRGRGAAVTTSTERAASLQAVGSTLDLRHVTATLIAKVVSSYWALVAAGRNRDVAAASSTRGAVLLDQERALIAADQAPRSDLASAVANAADREASRFVAEQAYTDAQQQLWLDMGYGPADQVQVAAVDDFSLFGELPDVRELPQDPEPFIAGALSRRADYLAAQARLDAARIAREASADGLRPQVDLSVNVGYTALSEGRAVGKYWSALATGVEGADVGGRISYRFPLENRLASGRFAAADAQFRQSNVARDDLMRTIRSSVIASYSAVRNSLLELARARESVDAFQEALRGEQDKLTLGIGSIVNLLTIEDRLTTASERQVAALQRYGQALIEFRLATGSLVPVHGDLPTLEVRTFTTFPFELAARHGN